MKCESLLSLLAQRSANSLRSRVVYARKPQ